MRYSRSLHATEAECNASESCRNAVDRVVIVSGDAILMIDRVGNCSGKLLFVLRMTGLYPKYVTTGINQFRPRNGPLELCLLTLVSPI
jgi:hypothetical protein